MRKITFFIATLVIAVGAVAQVTITKNWERSDSLGTNFAWNLSGDVTRGMAYGKMGANERVFVATRHSSGTKVHVLSAATGDSITSLNMTGVTGGTHVISDAGMTEDGKLLVCNMAMPGTLKIYKWENEVDAPTVAISWAFTPGRYGDKFTVTGNYTTGTAKVYAVMNVSGVTKVKYWDMKEEPASSGVFVFNQDPKDLGDVTNLGVLASVGVRPDGGYYFKINGAQIKQYSNTGVQIGVESLSSVVASNGNTVRYIADNDLGEAIIGYVRYSTTATTTARAGNHKIDILRVNNNNLAEATVLASTPSLGNNANGNGAGGLVVNKLPNNNVEIYFLSTNNGVAKYTLSGLFMTTGEKNTLNEKINISTLDNKLVVDGITPSSIELFNTIGQRVKSIENANELKTDNLQGVFVVRVKSEGKVVKTTKIAI